MTCMSQCMLIMLYACYRWWWRWWWWWQWVPVCLTVARLPPHCCTHLSLRHAFLLMFQVIRSRGPMMNNRLCYVIWLCWCQVDLFLGRPQLIAVLPANQCLSLGRGRRLRTSVATVYMSQHSARSVCLFIRVFRRCNVGQKMVICMQYDAVWKWISSAWRAESAVSLWFAIHNDVIVFLVRDSNERAIRYGKSVCQSVTRVDQSRMVEVRITLTHTIYPSSFCGVCFIHKFWRVPLCRGIKQEVEKTGCFVALCVNISKTLRVVSCI